MESHFNRGHIDLDEKYKELDKSFYGFYNQPITQTSNTFTYEDVLQTESLRERSPRRLSGANVPEDLVARVNGTKDWIDAMKVLQNLFNFSEKGAEENLRIILKDCNTVFTIELKETYSLVKNSSSRNERIKMFRKKLGKRYGPGFLKRIEHYTMECINVCSNRISTSK